MIFRALFHAEVDPISYFLFCSTTAMEQQRRQGFLKTQEAWRRNAFKLILKMIDWVNTTPGSKHLVDEMLHSIFFLGKVNNVPFTPENIIDDEEMLTRLREKYPRPFEFYLTQLPKRGPFSCVMDMIVLREGQNNENQIMQSLRDFRNSLEEKFLVSSTICVSQKSENSPRYYGVSMSAPGRNPVKIVIAASCCSAWDDYVSGAVMTYCLTNVQKTYFDGKLHLPEGVRCQAFTLSTGEEIPPCRSCGNLFGLRTDDKKEWAYGNCAEDESVSNLLRNEAEVKTQAGPTSPLFTPETREKAKGSVIEELRGVLRTIQFVNWKRWDYYTSS